jgi:hypothetical protein
VSRAARLGAAALLSALTGGEFAAAEMVTGQVYGLHTQRQVVLFRWELERDPTGRRWRSRYWTPDGQVAAEDEVIWDGATFAVYRYTRPPVGEAASVERRGDVLVYRQVVRGTARENQETFDDRVAVGPTVIPWVQRHWDRFGREPEITVRYAVPDQLRSFEFRLARVDGHPAAEAGTAVIKMSPSSPFVRLFVSPVYLVFREDGGAFRGMVGRLLPVYVRDGKARAVDGELVPDSAVELVRTGAQQR